MMRRILGISMPLLLVLVIVTGIAEARPSHAGLPVAHILISALFVITLCLHVWLNRKAFIKCYSIPKKART
jgi:heme A synthase